MIMTILSLPLMTYIVYHVWLDHSELESSQTCGLAMQTGGKSLEELVNACAYPSPATHI